MMRERFKMEDFFFNYWKLSLVLNIRDYTYNYNKIIKNNLSKREDKINKR